MSGRPTTIDAVVRGGLCTGCGICVSLLGAEQASMGLSPRGDLRPRFSAPLTEAQDADLIDICPGATVLGPDPQTLAPGTTLDPVWGPMRGLQRGWAGDPRLTYPEGPPQEPRCVSPR